MIKNKKNRQIRIIAMGMALCVLASPMPASAAESSVLMASGGVASVLEMERSLEEYIQIAQDAQGASWGYTNIGVANVESGNLNIRAVPSTDGKLVGKLPKDAACEVIETKDGWCHIKSGEVDGYVSREFTHRTGGYDPCGTAGTYGGNCQYGRTECTSGTQHLQRDRDAGRTGRGNGICGDRCRRLGEDLHRWRGCLCVPGICHSGGEAGYRYYHDGTALRPGCIRCARRPGGIRKTVRG
jgi:hypothetical protein